VFEQHNGVKLTPLRVGPLLEHATYENEVAAQKKGLDVRTSPTSATIESDALLLATVLRNLVSNAVKYTQPGGRILLGCRHTGQSVRIDVYDTGIGISGDQMPLMFDAFTRLDPALGGRRRRAHAGPTKAAAPGRQLRDRGREAQKPPPSADLLQPSRGAPGTWPPPKPCKSTAAENPAT
jgi:hypothetical protein